MSAAKLLLSYFFTLACFLVIDMLWLGVVAKGLYQKHLHGWMAPQVNWWAAGIFYLLFIAGIMAFVVMPALEKNSWQRAVGYGAFFGLITYATYDLTNLATLRNWPATLVWIDMIWGAVLTALVSTAGFFITKTIQ